MGFPVFLAVLVLLMLKNADPTGVRVRRGKLPGWNIVFPKNKKGIR